MSIFDNPPTRSENHDLNAAIRISKIMARSFDRVAQDAEQIREIVQRRGRAALVAEFGDEAADMVAKFNLMKDFAENKPDITLGDLPS